MESRALAVLIDRIRRPETSHEPAASLRYSGVVLGVVALAYWFTGWPLPRLTRANPNLNFYVAQPLVWLLVAVVAYYGWRRLADPPPFSRTLSLVAFGVGVVHVAVLVVAGFVAGFVDSPVAGRIINYPKNLLFVVTLLVGVETARAYLFHAWRRRDEQWAFVLTAVVFWAATIPAAQWTAVDSAARYRQIVGGRWLPALAVSLLATWLVAVWGMGPSFGYRFALLAFDWFAPDLPNLAWTGLMVVGVIGPLLGALVVSGVRAELRREETGEAGSGEPPEERGSRRRIGRWVTASLAVLIVLVWSGAFGVKPVVVEGISMEPAYHRGDIAFVRPDPDPSTLRIDDVVTYRQGGLVVIHRIVDISPGPEGPIVTTQGDNVTRPDRPVQAADIEGKVVLRVPLLGRLSLWLRDLL